MSLSRSTTDGINEIARANEKRIAAMAAKMADQDVVGSSTRIQIDGEYVYVPSAWITLAEACGHDAESVVRKARAV